MSDPNLAVLPPHLAPSDLEKNAIAEYESRKKPLTEAELQRLAAMGKKPELIVVVPVVPTEQLPALIAAADRALRDAGFREGPRVHRNRVG